MRWFTLHRETASEVRSFPRSNGVLPGTATGGTGSFMSMARFCGIVSCLESRAWSQVTALPVYADIRPMIAVSVLSATFLNSLIGLPARMLWIRSVCSWS